MYADYYNQNRFKIISEEVYNDGKVKYLDLVDARIIDKNCKQKGCGGRLESRGQKVKTFYDIEIDKNGGWTFLYITYHFRLYRCSSCGKAPSNINQIPENKFSIELERKIAEVLWSNNNTWQAIVEEYTIHNFKRKDKSNSTKTIHLITKGRIGIILQRCRGNVEKLIKSYAFNNILVYYPFVYLKENRGAVVSITDPYNETPSTFKAFLHYLSNKYNDSELANFLQSQQKTSHDEIKEIEEIAVSPLLLPLDRSFDIAKGATPIILLEGLLFDLEAISNSLGAEKSKVATKSNADIFEIVSSPPNKLDLFKEKMNQVFAEIDPLLTEAYDTLHKAYLENPYLWNKMLSLEANPLANKMIQDLNTFFTKQNLKGSQFKYLLTEILLQIPKTYSPIQRYNWKMGTLTNPTGQAISFVCGSASAVMLRPICDEYLIMPMVWAQNKYFLIVGYGDGAYCRYDIVRGTPRALMSYFNKQTMWEHNEIKRVYCPFDPNVVYALKPILYQSTLLVDGKDLVGSFAGKGISMAGIYTVISAAIYVFDSDQDTISERYPTWVSRRRPPWLADPRPNPLELVETYCCSEEELQQLEDIYARLSVAPELLWNLYAPDEKLAKCPKAQQLQKLSEVSESQRGFRRNAMEARLKPCIETANELVGHRVLMGYSDVEVDLQMLLDYLNSEVEQDNPLP